MNATGKTTKIAFSFLTQCDIIKKKTPQHEGNSAEEVGCLAHTE